MKGVDSSKADSNGMTNKPIITCAGDWNLFCTLEAPLVAAIPQDSCEWKRSYGRVTKVVYLESSFVKYSKDKLQSDNPWNLLKRPVFHIYWTDCADIEYYKTTLRDDIEQWLKQLEVKGITDYMIVLVETYDIRKTNKLLPRTTVLDKIKGDFAAKQTEDRFISVINPIKSEARSAESWRSLVAKLRQFVMISYNKILSKFEDYMREQREKRNDPEWDFCKYFLLQEQLAFVLEMLSLYEEALVQYDELDALFTQFVLNSHLTESPKWLECFHQPITMWQAVRLTALVPMNLRELIIKKKANLLEFRGYLFQRQCAMLLLTFKPWEIASRCLTTVHNTMKELNLLEVNIAEGAAACWALLACAETLRACERLSASCGTALEKCTAQQAPLLHYAKDKLHELGKLCGLLPGSPDPTSEQLHLVVMLSAGMGDSEINNQQTTPTDRLKEALCSKTSFQQYYLELAELAMGTYKHIGRLRFARLIGKDLATFYSELGETGKAVVFLMDALRSYEEQGWKDLAAQTRLELVACAQKMGDVDRYTKLSATIACTAELEILVRNFYYDEMMKSIRKNLADKTVTILAELSDCFNIISATLIPSERGVYITDNKIQLSLQLESLLPKDINCTKAAICIELFKETEDVTDKKLALRKTDLTGNVAQSNSPRKSNHIESDGPNFINGIRLADLKPKNPLLNPLNFTSQLHYKEDKSLQTATVECLNPKAPLKRTDSIKYKKPSTTTRSDFTNAFKHESFIIRPGLNDIILEYNPEKPGAFKIGQVSLIIEEKLEYLSNVLVNTKIGYEVVKQGVNVYLNKIEPKKDLIAGLEHAMELVVTSGSSLIQENATIHLKTSNGLLIRFDKEDSEMCRELNINVPPCKQFETTKVPLRLFANLQVKKDREKNVEHSIYLNCPWWESVIEVPLHFSPPMISSWRLLTSNTRKFLYVILKSTVAHTIEFSLKDPTLVCDGNTTVSDLNPKNGSDMIVASDGTTASFMWELLKDPLVKAGAMKATFSILYKPVTSQEPYRPYTRPFDIQDYTTLFVIRTKLEPSKGADFCRASQVCCLHLTVQRVNETEFTSLMYEVLADQTMWVVLGRTAGVITMDAECTAPQSVTLDVMPLVAGYLPLPTVRLSKYIAANAKDLKKDVASHPRLEPFGPGQVYDAGKTKQVHVLPPLPKEHLETN